jgi:hypothetical protein
MVSVQSVSRRLGVNFETGGIVGGLACVAVGGAINAYRIYGIMSRAGDPSTVRLKGTAFGFVMGAVFFGLPLWGIFAVLNHFV